MNIGGLPFLPSATGLVTQMPDELISDSPDSAFERATLPKGIESRLAKTDWSRRDVLVGQLGSREQLAVCLAQLFYYAPAKYVEKHLPVRRVAINQTASLFGKEAGIRWYGEVKNYRMVPRREIMEIPKDSDELYCRFEISEWKMLPRVIRPKGNLWAVHYTSSFLLDHAVYVSDLALRNEAEFRLLTELRRRTETAVDIGEDQPNVFICGDVRIRIEGAEILAIRGEKITARSSVSEFQRRPNAVIREMMAFSSR